MSGKYNYDLLAIGGDSGGLSADIPLTCITNSTFSRAVNTGIRLYAWNTKPILFNHMSAKSPLPSFLIWISSIKIWPLSGVSSLPMALSNVVLPEQDGSDRQANKVFCVDGDRNIIQSGNDLITLFECFAQIFADDGAHGVIPGLVFM